LTLLHYHTDRSLTYTSIHVISSGA
jgi:hypothetical protein